MFKDKLNFFKPFFLNSISDFRKINNQMEDINYKEINRQSWNNRVDAHVKSKFYDVPTFLEGRSSLNNIELGFLGEINEKSILHLQCHFGQDTISLARMGAKVTGIDLSDKAIDSANDLAKEAKVDARFICCDLYDLPNYLNDTFDIVFTSYGTIGWLPDLDKWAKIIATFLKPGGKLVFVEFHPVVWMFDDDFEGIKYNYFNTGPIIENESGTYADKEASINQDYVMWNHGMGEVVSCLIKNGLQIRNLEEYDYSPYNCFNGCMLNQSGQYHISKFGNKLPLVYAIVAEKS